MHYLSEMTEEQTLVMCSGHPQGLFPSNPAAPRVIITNGMVRKILMLRLISLVYFYVFPIKSLDFFKSYKLAWVMFTVIINNQPMRQSRMGYLSVALEGEGSSPTLRGIVTVVLVFTKSDG
mgnify:CR=1 FL=1